MHLPTAYTHLPRNLCPSVRPLVQTVGPAGAPAQLQSERPALQAAHPGRPLRTTGSAALQTAAAPTYRATAQGSVACVYVCMYMCVCMYVCTCVYVCVYVCMCVASGTFIS